MDVGVFAVLTDRTIPVTRLAGRLEALGFESLWLPDHVIMPLDTDAERPVGGRAAESYRRMADPLMLLAAAAGVTQTLRLGTAVLVLPLRHPLLLAKEVATLDRISDGRVRLGIGCGWVPEEAAIFGVDFDSRWERARDHAQALRACWAPGPSEHAGPFVRFPPLWSEPKPLQAPHPPLIVASDGPRALEYVADFGDGWMAHAARTPPEALARGRESLDGREITAFACPGQAETLRAYADAGADRAVLYLAEMEPAAAEAQLETWAETLL